MHSKSSHARGRSPRRRDRSPHKPGVLSYKDMLSDASSPSPSPVRRSSSSISDHHRAAEGGGVRNPRSRSRSRSRSPRNGHYGRGNGGSRYGGSRDDRGYGDSRNGGPRDNRGYSDSRYGGRQDSRSYRDNGNGNGRSRYDGRGDRDSRDPRDSRGQRSPPDHYEPRGPPRSPRGHNDSGAPRSPRDHNDPRGSRDNHNSRGFRDNYNPRDQRDSRHPRDDDDARKRKFEDDRQQSGRGDRDSGYGSSHHDGRDHYDPRRGGPQGRSNDGRDYQRNGRQDYQDRGGGYNNDPKRRRFSPGRPGSSNGPNNKGSSMKNGTKGPKGRQNVRFQDDYYPEPRKTKEQEEAERKEYERLKEERRLSDLKDKLPTTIVDASMFPEEAPPAQPLVELSIEERRRRREEIKAKYRALEAQNPTPAQSQPETTDRSQPEKADPQNDSSDGSAIKLSGEQATLGNNDATSTNDRRPDQSLNGTQEHDQNAKESSDEEMVDAPVSDAAAPTANGDEAKTEVEADSKKDEDPEDYEYEYETHGDDDYETHGDDGVGLDVMLKNVIDNQRQSSGKLARDQAAEDKAAGDQGLPEREVLHPGQADALTAKAPDVEEFDPAELDMFNQRFNEAPKELNIYDCNPDIKHHDKQFYWKGHPGERVNKRYVIRKNLGKGASAFVCRATDEHKGNRWVALKIVRRNDMFESLAIKEIHKLRKIKEFDRVAARSCVRFLDSFMSNDMVFMVFESMDGDMSQLAKNTYWELNKTKGLTLDTLREFSKQIMAGLLHLKKMNWAHCDIKPANLLYNEKSNQFRIADFGGAINPLDLAGEAPNLCTMWYRSPELILDGPWGVEIDMWAMGATLFELATNRILFPGISNNDQMRMMQEVLGKCPKWLRNNRARKEEAHFLAPGKPFYWYERKIEIIYGSPKPLPPQWIEKQRPHRPKELADDRDALKKFCHFVARMLDWIPAHRLTPEQALEHPFLDPTKELPRNVVGWSRQVTEAVRLRHGLPI